MTSPTREEIAAQNDVETLLTIGLDNQLLFMPDAPAEERLRFARIVAQVMRQKSAYDEPDRITEADLRVVQRVASAFKVRWLVYAAEKFRMMAGDITDYTYMGVDEDGEGLFECSYPYESTMQQWMPFTTILGTTEEFVAEVQRERLEIEEKARKLEEARREEARLRHLDLIAQQEARERAERERIFREVAREKGIDVP